MIHDNRRRYMRHQSDASVVMSHQAFGSITVKARDLSDGGICVEMGHHSAPPVGTVVDVVIKRHTGALNSNPVSMIVRHVQPGGIVGLQFA